MKCPFCGADETKVNDSRLANEGDSVRRRRECLACEERFTTYEKAELVMPHVIKQDGSRELFSEAKLRAGMLRSLEKRPVDTEEVEAEINGIIRRLRSAGEREISSECIGEWVMAVLRKLDGVAYVRFASVYRSFKDVNAFREAIESLESEPPEEFSARQISLISSKRFSNK